MLLSRLLLSSISGSIFLTASYSQEKVEKKRPNILIAICDDQSFSHTGFAGCTFVDTPGFDRIAGNGIYFSNCFAGSPGSAPSRGALVTGRHHWQNEQSGQHASSWMKKYIPLVDVLEKGGYHTGFTGKGVAPFQYARDERDSLWRGIDAAGKSYNSIRYQEKGDMDERTASGISRINYFENFKAFMSGKSETQPFYFWYGGNEAHRGFEKDSWKRNGKTLSSTEVPAFLPDNDLVRGDLLDYTVEIEWFDLHLTRMIDYLDSIGELENTIVIVTSDNGMSFPGAKAYCLEYGLHVPLAISFPKEIPGNRKVDDPVGFIDIVPTLLELTNLDSGEMMPIRGKSIVNILRSQESGIVDPKREYIFGGRERHSSSQWNNLGYPQRAIRNSRYLLVWNMRPKRWPAGAPQAIIKGQDGEIAPMYGIDKKGIYHPEWAFTDIDPSPAKSFIIEHHYDAEVYPFFHRIFMKSPEFELYDILDDPYCLVNLYEKKEYMNVGEKLKKELIRELIDSRDPRLIGPDHEVFDSYIRYGHMREFPAP